ncbi:MAG TPA: hypothetical protein V6D12_02380 [Candidatus Obscuribacterales bacterium]
MVSTPTPKSPVISESKIIHKSPVLHPLVRFVNEETAALLVKLKPQQVYRVECWQHVVYIHGEGVSKFVSYADFPPTLEVAPPTNADFVRWRKRWKSKLNRKQAPEFWQEFYAYHFNRTISVDNLREWGKLVGILRPGLSEVALEWLREVYRQEKYAFENF